MKSNGLTRQFQIKANAIGLTGSAAKTRSQKNYNND